MGTFIFLNVLVFFGIMNLLSLLVILGAFLLIGHWAFNEYLILWSNAKLIKRSGF